MNELYYLATPYSKFPGGLDAAFEMACRETALLMKAGVPVFSPIVHTHPVAMFAGMDPLDHSIWLPCDKPMMDASTGIIMLLAETWEQSYGMRIELEAFTAAGKDIVWMLPGVIPSELTRDAAKTTREAIRAMREAIRVGWVPTHAQLQAWSV